MRRLATKSRDDAYASQRDYQHIEEARSVRFVPRGPGIADLCLARPLADEPGPYAAGGYLRSTGPSTIEASINGDTDATLSEVTVGTAWQRFGMVLPSSDADELRLEIRWQSEQCLDVWGLTAGPVLLPPGVATGDTCRELGQTHLVPETFYFQHDAALDLSISPDSSLFSTELGSPIARKKCSYCGRWLPLDPERLGSLGFHKHNAKRTKHQNECRACKKWRINDTFNPVRTPDQLHESSLITRERRIFLREPEILQTIKLRTGAGLKAQVWKRFGQRCFYCDSPLLLEEVQLDHTRPLAYLWPIDIHATCLCAAHNNAKSDKFPVDFYTESELKKLSRICGLPLKELRKRAVNPVELRRVLGDLPSFARQWDPRHFAATARKIREIEPGIDLFANLADEDPEIYASIRARLDDRPSPVPDFTE
ncbi:MAG TPA: hypothetical protein VFN92_11300 [Solirubrobacterales bacterium]|nr:hypothetical protein [Solirubrobacterales bacterium]